MKRLYVIMKTPIFEDVAHEPCDVVSSMDRAESICTELHEQNTNTYYYWVEVISSEGD